MTKHDLINNMGSKAKEQLNDGELAENIEYNLREILFQDFMDELQDLEDAEGVQKEDIVYEIVEGAMDYIQ